jgi:hypothetical protein
MISLTSDRRHRRKVDSVPLLSLRQQSKIVGLSAPGITVVSNLVMFKLRIVAESTAADRIP